jgi:hypothetical protein
LVDGVGRAVAGSDGTRRGAAGSGGKLLVEEADANGVGRTGTVVAPVDGAVAPRLRQIADAAAILVAIDVGLASVADLLAAGRGQQAHEQHGQKRGSAIHGASMVHELSSNQRKTAPINMVRRNPRTSPVEAAPSWPWLCDSGMISLEVT